MTTLENLHQVPYSGTTKQKNIQQKTGPIILFALIGKNQDESKEKLELPNVIICRRYYEDQENDMSALKTQMPEVLDNITYLRDPRDVVKHLKPDGKNIVFVGQYFNTSMTGTEVATAVKGTGLNAEVSLITSIDVPYSERGDCDNFYKISKSMNQSDGANVIVQHLKSRIKNHVTQTTEVSPSVILSKKLDVLHDCLALSKVPHQLPKELSAYNESFEEFKQATKDCTDPFAKEYVAAFTKLCDILLKDL